jgi:mannose-6-phosphate isomerase
VHQRLFKIKGIVQHYSWGGYDFIPQLLGIDNKEGKPFAEYWLGAHPNHPSSVEDANEKLSDHIRTNAPAVLGEEIASVFSTLPFLFKILDVRQMLSIQVHPGKQSAAIGFAIEKEKGIPVTAAHRNYKDENHKPELMVALSDFWLLHGFKDEKKLREALEAIPDFELLSNIFNSKGYQALYEEVMTMSQEAVNAILKPIVDKIIPLYKNKELKKDQEDFWAARAAIDFCKEENYDRGIFSIYFFNLVHLKKGEGIFQPQGMPHAYLEGQNAEVMANSDNVLRAGLTDKHIDVAELMKHVEFKATIPDVLCPAAASHKVFSSPAKEFQLHQYNLNKDEEVATTTAEIWFLTSGTVVVKSDNTELSVRRGESFFMWAGTNASINPSEKSELFRVIVPGVTKN